MRLLWSLPRAAPALLRHFAAYIDLISLDLAKTSGEIAAQCVATVVTAIFALFSLLMGCLAVVAWTWDTPYRLTAIGCMGGLFFAATVAAALYRSKIVKDSSPVLGAVRREWHEDRVLLERILSEQDR